VVFNLKNEINNRLFQIIFLLEKNHIVYKLKNIIFATLKNRIFHSKQLFQISQKSGNQFYKNIFRFSKQIIIHETIS